MTGTGTPQLRLELPDARTSPGLARHAVAGVLSGLVSEECVDVAVLLVSELVTNVLLHTQGAAEMVVHIDPARLRVEVYDSSPTLPRMRRHELESTSGRGVWLVQRLATRWGAAPTPSGKCVWFEMPVHAGCPETHSDAESPSRSVLGGQFAR